MRRNPSPDPKLLISRPVLASATNLINHTLVDLEDHLSAPQTIRPTGPVFNAEAIARLEGRVTISLPDEAPPTFPWLPVPIRQCQTPPNRCLTPIPQTPSGRSSPTTPRAPTKQRYSDQDPRLLDSPSPSPPSKHPLTPIHHAKAYKDTQYSITTPGRVLQSRWSSSDEDSDPGPSWIRRSISTRSKRSVSSVRSTATKISSMRSMYVDSIKGKVSIPPTSPKTLSQRRDIIGKVKKRLTPKKNKQSRPPLAPLDPQRHDAMSLPFRSRQSKPPKESQTMHADMMKPQKRRARIPVFDPKVTILPATLNTPTRPPRPLRGLEYTDDDAPVHTIRSTIQSRPSLPAMAMVPDGEDGTDIFTPHGASTPQGCVDGVERDMSSVQLDVENTPFLEQQPAGMMDSPSLASSRTRGTPRYISKAKSFLGRTLEVAPEPKHEEKAGNTLGPPSISPSKRTMRTLSKASFAFSKRSVTPSLTPDISHSSESSISSLASVTSLEQQPYIHDMGVSNFHLTEPSPPSTPKESPSPGGLRAPRRGVIVTPRRERRADDPIPAHLVRSNQSSDALQEVLDMTPAREAGEKMYHTPNASVHTFGDVDFSEPVEWTVSTPSKEDLP